MSLQCPISRHSVHRGRERNPVAAGKGIRSRQGKESGRGRERNPVSRVPGAGQDGGQAGDALSVESALIVFGQAVEFLCSCGPVALRPGGDGETAL